MVLPGMIVCRERSAQMSPPFFHPLSGDTLSLPHNLIKITKRLYSNYKAPQVSIVFAALTEDIYQWHKCPGIFSFRPTGNLACQFKKKPLKPEAC